MKYSWDYERSWFLNLLIAFICIVLSLGCGFGFMCLNSWLIMLLWNAIVPVVFGFSAMTFWQTFGLCLILWLINGGINKIFIMLKSEED